MNRRDALRTLSLVVLATHLRPSRPDQPTGLPVIGVPLIAAGPNDPIMVSLRRGLTDRGYVEGTTIEIEHRFTHGKLEPLPGLVSEMVRKEVDIIVASDGYDSDHFDRLGLRSCGVGSGAVVEQAGGQCHWRVSTGGGDR